jgi:hypothetical protein
MKLVTLGRASDLTKGSVVSDFETDGKIFDSACVSAANPSGNALRGSSGGVRDCTNPN